MGPLKIRLHEVYVRTDFVNDLREQESVPIDWFFVVEVDVEPVAWGLRVGVVFSGDRWASYPGHVEGVWVATAEDGNSDRWRLEVPWWDGEFEFTPYVEWRGVEASRVWSNDHGSNHRRHARTLPCRLRHVGDVGADDL